MKKLFISLLIIGTAGLSAGAATFYAEITYSYDNHYTPHDLYVPVGTTVRWTNFENTGWTHDVVSDPSGPLNSGPLDFGDYYDYTFTTTGTFYYGCTYDPLVVGVVYVLQPTQLTFSAQMILRVSYVVQPAGGSFTFLARATNQTTGTVNADFWTKRFYDNNTFTYDQQIILQQYAFPPGPLMGRFSQAVTNPPPGPIVVQGNLGTNPHTVLAFANFTIIQLAADGLIGSGLEDTGWEPVMMSGWIEEPNPNAPIGVATAPQASKLSLSNSPEPFNPTTNINFTLPADGMTQMDVFSIAGAKVATLVNGYRAAGSHQVTFDASHLPSGMYLYRLSFGQETAIGKMMLVK